MVFDRSATQNCLSIDLNAPISILDLSQRPYNVLRHHKIDFVHQLKDLPKETICNFHNLGVKSLAEVQSKLSDYLSGGPDKLLAYLAKDTAPIRESIGTRMLVTILRDLTEQQRHVIRVRYGLSSSMPATLLTIGKKIGVTGERARQIEQRALTRLRARFGHGVLSKFLALKIACYLAANWRVTGGILTRTEAISCIGYGWSEKRTESALALLNDIECSDVVTQRLLCIEPEIYCTDEGIAQRSTAILQSIKTALNRKPLSESRVQIEIQKLLGRVLTRKDQRLMKRLLSVSPSVTRLENGDIVLSHWLRQHSAEVLAEVALLHLMRPAHFREITTHICTLFRPYWRPNERTVLNYLLRRRRKFVRIGRGTYGLRRWKWSRSR